VLALAIMFFAAPNLMAAVAVPQGVWLLEQKAAVQIYDCDGLMCGRILWLAVPRDPQGELDLDKYNPDLGLRQRKLCGLTIISSLEPDGANRWKNGSFYNPDDGKTYRVTAQLKSDDVMVVRIYLLLPLFGKTKTLVRVRHGITEGWC